MLEKCAWGADVVEIGIDDQADTAISLFVEVQVQQHDFLLLLMMVGHVHLWVVKGLLHLLSVVLILGRGRRQFEKVQEFSKRK